MTCTHTSSRAVWCEPDGWEHEEPYQVWEKYATTEDLDLSRYRCTRCGEVFYYTGRWRDYHENGTPCLGSDRVARVPPNADPI
jgi:hypothetical protein